MVHNASHWVTQLIWSCGRAMWLSYCFFELLHVPLLAGVADSKRRAGRQDPGADFKGGVWGKALGGTRCTWTLNILFVCLVGLVLNMIRIRTENISNKPASINNYIWDLKFLLSCELITILIIIRGDIDETQTAFDWQCHQHTNIRIDPHWNFLDLLTHGLLFPLARQCLIHEIKSEVLGLDDKAGIIKMMYSILARQKLLNLLSHGMPTVQSGELAEPQFTMTLEEMNNQIQQKVKEDPFLLESAPNIISWRELGDPESLFASCSTQPEVTEIEKALLERIAHSKTAIAALRKSTKDGVFKSISKFEDSTTDSNIISHSRWFEFEWVKQDISYPSILHFNWNSIRWNF